MQVGRRPCVGRRGSSRKRPRESRPVVIVGKRRIPERRRASHARFRDGQGSPLPWAPARARSALAGLHCRTLFIKGIGHWVKFVALRAEATAERPHGPSRTLRLHAPDGTRPVGFDNAHPARRRRGHGTRRRRESGHGHRMPARRPHECRDATTLPGDFRKEAGAVLKARGVIPQSRCRSELRATIGCWCAPWRSPEKGARLPRESRRSGSRPSGVLRKRSCNVVTSCRLRLRRSEGTRCPGWRRPRAAASRNPVGGAEDACRVAAPRHWSGDGAARRFRGSLTARGCRTAH